MTAPVHIPFLDVEVVIAAAETPVPLSDAKEWLRVDGSDQDAQITALILAATMWAENLTRRTFVDTTLAVKYACFPLGSVPMYLVGPRVVSISGITYEDDAGAGQTLDPTDFTIDPTYGIVTPNAGIEWPQGVRWASFQYVAGWADGASVPEQIKTAIKIAVATMYEVRTDQVVGTIVSTPQVKASMALLQDFRVFSY